MFDDWLLRFWEQFAKAVGGISGVTLTAAMFTPFPYVFAGSIHWLANGFWPDWSLLALGVDLPDPTSWVGINAIIIWIWTEISVAWVIAAALAIVGIGLFSIARNTFQHVENRLAAIEEEKEIRRKAREKHARKQKRTGWKDGSE